MKITSVLMLVFSIQVSASVYAQTKKFDLTLNEISVKEVLKTIESQSDFRFFYNDELSDVNRVVSVDVENMPVEGILSSLFDRTKVTYMVLENNLIVISPSGLIQQQRITGKITDASSGEPLAGVYVLVKGTQNGSITDVDGNYSILVTEANPTLVFSYIGFISEEIALEGRTTLDVELIADVTSLEEVVVVGYGVQKKVNMTGAVSAVKVDETITNRALTNVSSSLSGLVPGLAVNQNSGMAGNNNATMMIRGLGSVNNANPLVVVDGMPDVDINRINMNDIESISILKDATSSAVYGSRAANGVILITTKSGKGQDKNKINFTGTYGITQPTKAYNFMADYPRALTLHQRSASVSQNLDQQLFRPGTIDQWMALGMIDPLRYPNTDWWDVIMRQGQVQNYNLSSSGGNERSNFFISLGLMDEKGLQINNDYTRYNARFNYEYKVNKSINVGARFSGNWSNMVYSLEDGFIDDNATNTAGLDLQYAIAGITPYDPVSGYYGGVMAYNEDAQAYNPYTVYVNTLTHRNRQEVNPSAYIDWTPVKGLTARVDYNINYYNQFSWNANNPNRAYNFQTGAYGSRIYVGENAGVGNNTQTGYKTMLNGRLGYEKTIANNHDLSAMFVYSEEYWYGRTQTGSRTYRIHPSLHELDAALTLPGEVTAGGNSYAEGLRSYIGRLNYTGFDKYLLEINFRYDGSSKFLEGHKYGFFPSAALGWRFTQEEFVKNILPGWMSSGKLRLSYGSLGNNSGVQRYEQRELLELTNYMTNGNAAKGFVYTKMVNEELSWESTSVTNVGMDLTFFGSKLTAELDYYDRLTTGMLRPQQFSVHLSSAYDAPRKNIGDLRNRGVEANLTWKDRRGQFNYMLNLNASYNRTTLEKWNEFLAKGWVFLDMPYHFLYTYEDIGIAQTWQDVYDATPQSASPGDILRKDVNGDGRIDSNDKVAYPNVQRDRPTTNFALNGNVGWKGFDVSFLLQGATGRKDYWINNYNNVNFGAQRYASTWEHWNNPWNWDNRDGDWPRLAGNANREETTFWLDDLSYLRIKNVQLGYNIPKSILNRIFLDSFRIYVTAENLHTFTKFRGLDPEGQGHKSDTYPINKSFSFGVNIGI